MSGKIDFADLLVQTLIEHEKVLSELTDKLGLQVSKMQLAQEDAMVHVPNRSNARMVFRTEDVETSATLYVKPPLYKFLVAVLHSNKLTVTLRFEGEGE